MGQKLLIDISAAVNQRAGIGRYARELTRQLVPMLDSATTHLWYAEEENPYDPELSKQTPWDTVDVRRSRISRLNVDRLFVCQHIPLQRLLRLGKPTDVYSPDFTAPAPEGARSHVTVHDLAWLHPEAETPKALTRFLGPVVERSVRSAATVFTVSEAIKTEIVNRFPVPPERVIVAPNAAAEHFHGARAFDDEALAAFGLRRPYVLSVGTIERRKNLAVLFDALALCPPSLQLAVIGRAGWDAPAILEKIDELGLSGRVVRLGFVPDDVLPRLMASASAVVYPSRYEGFGLPVIEALATGTSVIASDLPVFREVGGECVAYFDPENPVELAKLIERESSTPGDMSRRVERMAAARRFDWKSSAAIVAQRLQGFQS